MPGGNSDSQKISEYHAWPFEKKPAVRSGFFLENGVDKWGERRSLRKYDQSAEQNEEEYRGYNDRNECEDNFLNVGHETSFFYHRLNPKDIGKTIAFVNIA